MKVKIIIITFVLIIVVGELVLKSSINDISEGALSRSGEGDIGVRGVGEFEI